MTAMYPYIIQWNPTELTTLNTGKAVEAQGFLLLLVGTHIMAMNSTKFKTCSYKTPVWTIIAPLFTK